MKNRILLSLLFLFTFSYSFAQSISGVVTYFFNDNIGSKPDLGAKVYCINSSTYPKFNFELVENFYYAKTYRAIYLQNVKSYNETNELIKLYEGKRKLKDEYDKLLIRLAEKKKDIERDLVKLQEFGAETDDKFRTLDKSAVMEILMIQTKSGLISRTVDGNGNYSINVKPDTYYVLITSKNREGVTVTETAGKVFIKKVLIKENETKDVSYDFDLY